MKNRKKFFVYIGTIFIVGLLVFTNVVAPSLFGDYAEGTKQYLELGRSFLEGQISFSDEYVERISGYDMAYHNGKYYWPLGPFPGILIIPFVVLLDAIGLSESQGFLNLTALAVIFWSLYLISKKIGYTNLEIFWWIVAFCFGTMFMGVAMMPKSWYLAHTIGIALTFLAIAEYFGGKRWWLIGTLIAGVFLTRITAGLSIVFFILVVIFEARPRVEKAKNLVALIAPILMAVLLLGIYNYVRFDSVFNTGYQEQLLPHYLITNGEKIDLFSIRYIPINFYYMFLNIPTIVNVGPFMLPISEVRGVSIFVTSPWLLGILFFSYKKRDQLFLLITIFIIAIPILLFFSSGCGQFGYRYALDFLPLLFVLFLVSYREKFLNIKKEFIVLLSITAVWNMLLFFAGIYAKTPVLTSC